MESSALLEHTQVRQVPVTSDSFVVEISVRPPRELFISFTKKYLFWIKVSKKYIVYFWKQKHCLYVTHCFGRQCLRYRWKNWSLHPEPYSFLLYKENMYMNDPAVGFFQLVPGRFQRLWLGISLCWWHYLIRCIVCDTLGMLLLQTNISLVLFFRVYFSFAVLLFLLFLTLFFN